MSNGHHDLERVNATVTVNSTLTAAADPNKIPATLQPSTNRVRQLVRGLNPVRVELPATPSEEIVYWQLADMQFSSPEGKFIYLCINSGAPHWTVDLYFQSEGTPAGTSVTGTVSFNYWRYRTPPAILAYRATLDWSHFSAHLPVDINVARNRIDAVLRNRYNALRDLSWLRFSDEHGMGTRHVGGTSMYTLTSVDDTYPAQFRINNCGPLSDWLYICALPAHVVTHSGTSPYRDLVTPIAGIPIFRAGIPGHAITAMFVGPSMDNANMRNINNYRFIDIFNVFHIDRPCPANPSEIYFRDPDFYTSSRRMDVEIPRSYGVAGNQALPPLFAITWEYQDTQWQVVGG